jgi:hypothetical protein
MLRLFMDVDRQVMNMDIMDAKENQREYGIVE